MVEIPYNRIIDFLRGIVPFNEFLHEVLTGLPQKISIDCFTRESLILHAFLNPEQTASMRNIFKHFAWMRGIPNFLNQPRDVLF